MPEGTGDLEKHTQISAAERDKLSPVWDMSQERVFMEQLLNQRFNFFLVFFSLMIAGAVNSKKQIHLQLVLTLGAIICTLLAAVLIRTQVKLDLILTDLFSDPSHPAAIINKSAGNRWSMRRIIGIWIPLLCSAALIIAAFAALTGLLCVLQANG